MNSIYITPITLQTLDATPLWRDYALLDSGGLQKLERLGELILIRPEPQAVWQSRLPEAEWYKQAQAVFRSGSHFKGEWEILPAGQKKKMNKQWVLQYESQALKFDLRLSLTTFKNIGVFPEQASNWEYIYAACQQRKQPQVLNLFAYTGGGSIAAVLGGARVTHIDALKSVVQWAAENFIQNQMNDKARRLVDDALKFVQREIRRGNHYQGIILDPPASGNGPNGEKWSFEAHITELLTCAAQLLDPQSGFVVFNSYSLGYSAYSLVNLTQNIFPPRLLKKLEAGELVLSEKTGKNILPAGVYARFQY